ncbi:hypothetical protein EV191_1395 [Tamaricihabitans halophyticus]|uniref:Uncharacterized protein n=1 Tax=Tamaricihabitans halophyticus TaxID=1262583 RepID=A0A4R2PS65_9PSEU|nr:hypothetical protein EV191_1395 [Tamaricihabitans halophyticus]
MGVGALAGGGVVCGVVVEVAGLAPGAEVFVVAVFGGVVEVGGGEDDAGAGEPGGLVVAVAAACVVVEVAAGSAAFAAAFAPSAGAVESDAVGDLAPVVGVAVAVFGSDRH